MNLMDEKGQLRDEIGKLREALNKAERTIVKLNRGSKKLAMMFNAGKGMMMKGKGFATMSIDAGKIDMEVKLVLDTHYTLMNTLWGKVNTHECHLDTLRHQERVNTF